MSRWRDGLSAGRRCVTLARSVPLVLAAILLVGGCGEAMGPGASSASATHPMIGVKAPDFELPGESSDKQQVTLADGSGKVTLVDFWATWCAPCKESFPVYEKLHEKLGDKLQIIGLSVNDDPSGIAAFAKDTGAKFELGWDKGQKVAAKYKVATMPTSYLIDQSGIIRFVYAGFHEGDGKKIEQNVQSLLQQQQ